MLLWLLRVGYGGPTITSLLVEDDHHRSSSGCTQRSKILELSGFRPFRGPDQSNQGWITERNRRLAAGLDVSFISEPSGENLGA